MSALLVNSRTASDGDMSNPCEPHHCRTTPDSSLTFRWRRSRKVDVSCFNCFTPGSTLRPCFPVRSVLKHLKHETQTKPVANAFITHGHELGHNKRHVRRYVRAHVGIAGTPRNEQ